MQVNGMEPAPVEDMRDTTAIPELDTPRKPEPELKKPKPEPDVKRPPDTEIDFDKDDQADSGPDKDNPLTQDASTHPSELNPTDAHIGARENQVSDTQAPAGDAYEDEPRQG
jgi:hypothetical protein